MRDLRFFLEAYEKDHRNPVNKLIHYICVPLIVTCSVGIGWAVSDLLYGGLVGVDALPWVNLGSLGLAAAMVFYARLSRELLVSMLGYAVVSWLLLYALWAAIGGLGLLLVTAGLWVAAWALQFVGHKYEGAAPSFTNDPVFLLVGPAFCAEKIYRRFGSSLLRQA